MSMRNRGKMFVLVICMFFSTGMNAQKVTRRVCDTIHYEFVHDKIVIPVTVNGVTVKYIVDTGGQTGTVREAAVEMKAVCVGGTRGVSDVNGMSLSYGEAILNDVLLSPHYRLGQMKSMILPSNGFFKELGVVGILGSDAFAQSVITFDARDQLMVVNHPYRPEGLKITEGVQLHANNVSHPIVDVDFGGVTKQVLFDTGANGLLSLSVDDCSALGGERIRLLANAHGIVSVGIGGFDYKNAATIQKVSVDTLRFAGKEFTNVESITGKMGMTLIGVDLLKYGKVVIDYMRNRFYYFPFQPVVEDMSGQVKNWNVGILPVDGRFEITTVWDSMQGQVALGDQVLSVNGKDLSGLKQSQLEIEALLDAVEGERAELVILKDGIEKKIEIRKM